MGNFHFIRTCLSFLFLLLIGSSALRAALQVIAINQPACDQARPSTAASSQPALLSVNGARFPHTAMPLATLNYVSGQQFSTTNPWLCVFWALAVSSPQCLPLPQ